MQLRYVMNKLTSTELTTWMEKEMISEIFKISIKLSSFFVFHASVSTQWIRCESKRMFIFHASESKRDTGRLDSPAVTTSIASLQELLTW